MLKSSGPNIELRGIPEIILYHALKLLFIPTPFRREFGTNISNWIVF